MDYSLIVKLTNNCNLNCSYCYHRRDHSRSVDSSMDRESIELMIKQLLQHNEEHAEFIWHGGEPLLAGLDMFRFIVETQKRYNIKEIDISNSVQTNGTLLNEDYIDFFQRNNFHVGVSIDGPFDMHTAQRGTYVSEYETILKAISKLNDGKTRFGVLCVVGKQHIGQAQRILSLLQEYQIKHIGLLPCLVQENGVVDHELTITPDEYAEFLIDMFELWIHGDFHGLAVRNFDDCIRFFRNRPAKTCINTNSCDRYLTVMPNGEIYLCDNFSANQEHRVGHISTGFDKIDEASAMQWLKDIMHDIPSGCQKCKYYCGCYSGCKYRRWVHDQSMKKGHYYCLSTHKFYDHVGQYFQNREEE